MGQYQWKSMKIGDPADKNTVEYFLQNGQKLNGDCLLQLTKESVGVMDGEPTYHTLVKSDQNWNYAGCCFIGEIYNRDLALMPKIYIVSRLRGKNRRDRQFNERVTKYVARMIVEEGGIPVAPHLYFPGFLDDDNSMERAFGMKAGHELMKFCDTFLIVTIDGVVSAGMAEDIAALSRCGISGGRQWTVTRRKMEELMKAVR